jgi:hypothetical protein
MPAVLTSVAEISRRLLEEEDTSRGERRHLLCF